MKKKIHWREAINSGRPLVLVKVGHAGQVYTCGGDEVVVPERELEEGLSELGFVLVVQSLKKDPTVGPCRVCGVTPDGGACRCIPGFI